MSKASNGQTPQPDKVVEVDKLLKNFTKKFGEESLLIGNQISYKGDVIPTGSLVLDYAVGVGGIPQGRIIEIFGGESSGKSTLCLTIIAEAQKKGLLCALVDTESTFDRAWADTIGVQTEKLLFAQPGTMEAALDQTRFLIENGVGLVVFDSVAGAPVAAEVEGEAGDATIGVKARLMSKMLPVLTTLLREHNATLIFTNQVRSAIGSYVPTDVTSGGRALPFYASLRMELRKTQIKSGTEIVGNTIKVKVVKNKVAPPFRTAELTLYFGKGFYRALELLSLGLKLEIVEKAGSWFFPAYRDPDKKLKFQGQEAFCEWLEENPEEYQTLENIIRQKVESSGQLEKIGVKENDVDYEGPKE